MTEDERQEEIAKEMNHDKEVEGPLEEPEDKKKKGPSFGLPLASAYNDPSVLYKDPDKIGEKPWDNYWSWGVIKTEDQLRRERKMYQMADVPGRPNTMKHVDEWIKATDQDVAEAKKAPPNEGERLQQQAQNLHQTAQAQQPHGADATVPQPDHVQTLREPPATPERPDRPDFPGTPKVPDQGMQEFIQLAETEAQTTTTATSTTTTTTTAAATRGDPFDRDEQEPVGIKGTDDKGYMLRLPAGKYGLPVTDDAVNRIETLESPLAFSDKIWDRQVGEPADNGPCKTPYCHVPVPSKRLTDAYKAKVAYAEKQKAKEASDPTAKKPDPEQLGTKDEPLMADRAPTPAEVNNPLVLLQVDTHDPRQKPVHDAESAAPAQGPQAHFTKTPTGSFGLPLASELHNPTNLYRSPVAFGNRQWDRKAGEPYGNGPCTTPGCVSAFPSDAPSPFPPNALTVFDTLQHPTPPLGVASYPAAQLVRIVYRTKQDEVRVRPTSRVPGLYNRDSFQWGTHGPNPDADRAKPSLSDGTVYEPRQTPTNPHMSLLAMSSTVVKPCVNCHYTTATI
eukprot:TRINITY_DN66894_c5_g2_i2.p1 TRINITY_DN66894_c5_g2~~TRINITY_DN66894_c5_g2_i2.p1  ORF type:complete len:631 (-),score=297.91 TRINITY_DN66894_c5_g2_i2:81-1769(-)